MRIMVRFYFKSTCARMKSNTLVAPTKNPFSGRRIKFKFHKVKPNVYIHRHSHFLPLKARLGASNFKTNGLIIIVQE